MINNFAGPLNEKQMRYAKNISVSGRHLLGLINDILDLSKAESGKMEIQCQQVSVS
ncbi:histidine kinase dimerization/phospho-acceptor domain-containing protein [Methanosarcina horonobensis]|uniref:histidine kinase dimerization/phospho-acceptor domain-containing protein n=1 Tax=Methanosarcina horonobensis TaxID=418008 RepID=UPI000ACB81AE